MLAFIGMVSIVCTFLVGVTGMIGAIRLSCKPLLVYGVSYLSYCVVIGIILISSYTHNGHRWLDLLSGFFFVSGVACNIIFELVLNGRDELYSKNVSLLDVILLRRPK